MKTDLQAKTHIKFMLCNFKWNCVHSWISWLDNFKATCRDRQVSLTSINPRVTQNSTVSHNILKPFSETNQKIVTLTVIFNKVFFHLTGRRQSVKQIYDTKFIKRTAKITELIDVPMYLFNENDFLLPRITSQVTEVTDKDQSTPCQSHYWVA